MFSWRVVVRVFATLESWLTSGCRRLTYFSKAEKLVEPGTKGELVCCWLDNKSNLRLVEVDFLATADPAVDIVLSVEPTLSR